MKENKKNKRQRIVKFNNNLSEVPVAGLTTAGLNLMMAIISQIRPEHVDMEEGVVLGRYSPVYLTFTYNQLRELLGVSSRNCSNTDLQKQLETMQDGLLKTSCLVEDGSHRIKFTLFPYFDNDLSKQTLTMEIHQCFQYLFRDLASRFTAFKLEEFLSLKGKAEKILYIQIRKNRGIGKITYADIDECKEFMGISLSYDSRNFIAQYIKPAVEKLKKVIPSLEYRAIKDGSSHKLVGFELIFDVSTEDLKGTVSLEQVKRFKTPAPTIRNITPQIRKDNQFNDFPQRTYTAADYEDLERRKVGRL